MGESSWNGYEHNCLFANLGAGQFADVARPAGCDGIQDARAVAPVDLDSDGRLDLVIANNDAAPTIYLNRFSDGGRWLAFDLQGRQSGREGLGTRVRLSVGGEWLSRWVEAGSGYASQAPQRLHFGLGAADRVDEIEVRWPSGQVDRGELDEVDRVVRLVEGAPIADSGHE